MKFMTYSNYEIVPIDSEADCMIVPIAYQDFEMTRLSR